jgi:hypothetical protein
MPLIPFPNVPELPGVPDLRRAAVGLAVRTGIYGKIESFDRFGILDILIGPPYQIVSAVTGEPIIRPDSVIALEYKGESRLAGYPMEKGAFSTYNKVQMPYDIRIRMTCSGNSWMKREDFIFKMDEIKKSLEMLQIITPDIRYTGVNLVRWDYKRTAQNGVSLLTVDAMFSEVRENATAVYGPVKEPASADPESMSCIAPLDPTTAQASEFGMGQVA